MFVRNPMVPMTVIGIVAIVLIWATALRPVSQPIEAASGASIAAEWSPVGSAHVAAARGR